MIVLFQIALTVRPVTRSALDSFAFSNMLAL